MSESPQPQSPEQPDSLAAYTVPAFRFTIALDVHATTAEFATTLVLEICRALANIAVDPTGGKQLHDAIGGRLLNLLCFNDAQPATEPINPAEVTAMRELAAQLQQGDPAALQALFGGGGLVPEAAPAPPPPFYTPGNGDATP